MVISPVGLTTREDRNRPGRNICTKRQFGRVAEVRISGGGDLVAGENSNSARNIGPDATLAVSPRLNSR